MRPLLRHLALGAAAGLAAAFLGLLPPAELLELKAYDLLHAVKRPPTSPPAHVVIVAIDEASFAEIGRQWPWPRSLHGRLVDGLRRRGASVVAFDVLFSESSTAEEDRSFAGSVRRAGNVILASDIERLDDPRFVGDMAVEPLEALREGAGTGIVTVPVDRDGVVRRYPPSPDGEPLLAEAAASRHAGRELRAPDGAYIAYAGAPGTFPTVSYYQALDPDTYLPPGFFEGKVVLVGLALKTAPEVGRPGPDMFATPFLFAGQNRLTAAVEIHANMIRGILEGRFVRRLPRGKALVCFLLLGLLGSAVQARWRPLRGGLSALGLLALYEAFALYLFFGRGLWVPTVLPALCVALPYGFLSMDAYLQSERKRREIRRAFGHYLSPAILKEILRDPKALRLGGRKVEATVLFSDLADFSSLAERVTPEALSRFLNRHFTEMARIVHAHQGAIDKFIGDAVMAFWGAPLQDPQQAANACRAALAMQERMGPLREEARAEGLPPVRMRIGINTGQVIAGNMGSAELFNYSVIGDAVNVASRLEGANKDFGTEILISETVRRRAGSGIRVRPLGRIKVKGKNVEVEVFELCGLADPPG